MTGFDEELDVGVHERDGHCHVTSIGEDEFRVIAELLDKAEHVVLKSTLSD
jgi:hypothetical protein